MPTTKPRPRKPPELWAEIGGERHRIIFIEYRDGHPFSVVTEEHWDHTGKPWFRPDQHKATGTCARHWDFEWCRRDGVCYYHNIGGGGGIRDLSVGPYVEPDPPPGAIWCAPGVVLCRYASKARPKVRIRSDATLLKMGYRRLGRPLLLPGGNAWDSPKRSRNPFAVSEATESGCYYCAACGDWLPRDGECEHYEWCDLCGCLATVDGHIREDSHDGNPTEHDEDEED